MELKNVFAKYENIVVLSGAGISTSAGIKDFRSTAGTKRSSRNMFDMSVYCTEQAAHEFHEHLFEMLKKISKLEPTLFHRFLDGLASSGRLLRHYTQNIDCIDAMLEPLSQATVHLHGRLDRLYCYKCNDATEVAVQNWEELLKSPCANCESRNRNRPRPSTPGVYIPKILLYGDSLNPDESDTLKSFDEILRQPIDAVVIAGTRLEIKPIKNYALQLCKKVKEAKGVTVWINVEHPSDDLIPLFTHQMIETCDKAASIIGGLLTT
ncbi:DHS-like NAD/FAD-binding domain-containing protein [Zopfia rhizophila CBS 207.26]|uniref:DHS-like NAD/FAD-binding domain-containing protein n=1 Tax=Zopfia rhizophila CBS 207.26 TaxID=1314779 RepID=A0A6A6D7Y5_9PEZI|nr:DHS-like NAD/FAD-binding domain-containing protein [Zopfia rhizophila CBS 207.26]